MNLIGRQIFVFAASIFSVTAFAADFDGSEPLMCSFGQVIECEAGFQEKSTRIGHRR